MKTLPLILGLSLILLAGCESDNGSGPATPTDPQGWINLAWSQFETWDLENSQISFSNAYQLATADSLAAYQDSVNAVNVIPPDSAAMLNAVARLAIARDQLVQIFSGGGWLGTRAGVVSGANSNFNTSLALNPNYLEALGGHAFNLQALQNWVQSNEKATVTLAANPAWVFDHDTQINYLDLRLVRAENYFNMGQFETSLYEALALNAIVNPLSPLGQEDFNLATIEGRMALQELIYNLDVLI